MGCDVTEKAGRTIRNRAGGFGSDHGRFTDGERV
jgi:hypothetical protein